MIRLKMLRILLLMLGTGTVTAFILIVLFFHWLDKTYTREMCFVRICPSYRAIIPGEHGISTKLYQLGPYMRFLLVLTSKSLRGHEAYYIDVHSHEIGVPDFGNYRPFRKSALVSWLACEGFPDDGAVAADWDWINDDTDLRVRVRGLRNSPLPVPPSNSLGPGTTERSSSDNAREMIRLAYGRDIILHYKGQGE